VLDDISPLNFKRLRGNVRNPERLTVYADGETTAPQPEMAAYKDPAYRERIANRFGLTLTLNPLCFNEPHRYRVPAKSLLDRFREKYGG
jgi:hypothetical protein